MILKKLLLTVCLIQAALAYGQSEWTQGMKTFGSTGKELTVLKKEKEVALLEHTGKGALTHMWFGGDFEGYGETLLKVYVDGEVTASIDMELFLGHGIGFNDNYAPWTVSKMGKTGAPSGIYNTFRIPFSKSVKVTAQLSKKAPDSPKFWWIIRGTENLRVNLGGVTLPENAKLRLHKVVNKEYDPLVEFDMCNVKGDGALFMVTVAAKGLRIKSQPEERWKDLSYQEACVRAYIGGSKTPLLLSSGLEDYFMGTYYFNKGRFYSDVAGLTHFDAEKNEFSAYRIHDEDPVFFSNGLRLTNRVGEKIGDFIFHDPPRTRYTTYVWTYEW